MQKDVLCIFKKCVRNVVTIFKKYKFYILKIFPQKTSIYVKKKRTYNIHCLLKHEIYFLENNIFFLIFKILNISHMICCNDF